MHDVNCYQYLASAVAGRRVSVHRSRDPVLLPCSDGAAIWLPPPAQCGDAVAWIAVVSQAALIGAGSLEPAILRRLVGRAAAARRYAGLEAARAAQVLSARMPGAFTVLPELHAPGGVTASAEQSLERACRERRMPEPSPLLGTVRPAMVLRRAVRDEGLAGLLQQRSRSEPRHPPAEADDRDAPGEKNALSRLLQNPFAAAPFVADALQRFLGAAPARGRRDPASSSAGREMPVGRVVRALRRGVQAVRGRSDVPDVDARAEAAAFTYPEWDVGIGGYRPAWAVVEEVDAWRLDGPRDIAGVLAPDSRELRRQLSRLGLDHEMHRRQTDGQDLDVGRLTACAIELSTGHSPSSLDVYRTSRRTRRDLAVMILLDISGSTGEREPVGASVFERQMRVAFQLGRSLHDLGDMVAISAFHSWGRKLVRAVRLKGAGERWGGHVTRRFSLLEPAGFTRTGAAIRHGDHVLRTAMRLPNRLLVLITDGIAYDQDYEAAYAEADAGKALEEVRARGTACVCLCVGGSTEAQRLHRVFGAASLLMVDDPREITARIRLVSGSALAQVSRRRFPARRAA